MKEFVDMLNARYPGASRTQEFQKNSWKWVRQFNELARLRNRRPDVWESAVSALITYVGERARREQSNGSDVLLNGGSGLGDM